MANETTSSTISELYTEIVAEAMFTASEQSIMKTSSKKLHYSRWWKIG
jgi:hypothetical protein